MPPAASPPLACSWLLFGMHFFRSWSRSEPPGALVGIGIVAVRLRRGSSRSSGRQSENRTKGRQSLTRSQLPPPLRRGPPMLMLFAVMPAGDYAGTRAKSRCRRSRTKKGSVGCFWVFCSAAVAKCRPVLRFARAAPPHVISSPIVVWKTESNPTYRGYRHAESYPRKSFTIR